jgi:hypothetical protein
MRNVIRYFLLLFIHISQVTCFTSYCQVADTTGAENDILESVVENENTIESGVEDFEEQRESLLKNPLQINTASYIELLQSGLFTDVQCRNLLQHIKNYGALLSIYELQTIPGFEVADINMVRYFITTGKNDHTDTPLYKEFYTGKYQYFVRFSKILNAQDGYSGDTSVASPYLGNNLRLYTRLKYNYNNRLLYGITAEKDPGEAFFGESQPKGFDYYSVHFLKRNSGFLNTVALGDYEINIGQGLVFWSGFGYGKSVYPIAVRKTGKVLDAYTSVDENRFLRGAAVTLGNKNLYITPFISYKKIDANISLFDSIDAEVLEVSSLQTSGLHRTAGELADKDAIQQTIGGIDVSYYKEQFHIGASAVYQYLNTVINKDLEPYEYFDLENNRLINASVHYNYLWRNILFYGETAASNNKKIGTINGCIIPLDRSVDIAVVHRYYDKAYQSLYANAFADASTPSNEQGTYLGIEVKPSKPWKIAGYVDVYKHPWLTFLADGPSYGTDVLGELNFKPAKNFETYFRIKNEVSDANLSTAFSEDLPHDILVDRTKRNMRWNVVYKINTSFTVQSRIEYSFFEEATTFTEEKGYLIYQDLKYHPLGMPVSFSARFALFNTDSYNARIYVYENDVLYAYSIVALYGRGTRNYITVAYSPFTWMDIWVRYARTFYTTEEITSSADIQGPAKSDGRIQLRIKW